MTIYDITGISDTFRIEYLCDNGITVHTVEFLSTDANLIQNLAKAQLAEAVIGVRFKDYPVVRGKVKFSGGVGGSYSLVVRSLGPEPSPDDFPPGWVTGETP